MAQDAKKAGKKLSGARKALVAVAVVLMLAVVCCGVAFAVDESSRTQHVPQTTMLDGQVDVSGMTADELRALLEKRVEGGVATTLVVSAGDTGQIIDMSEIGTIDIDATVEQAFAPYHDNPLARFAGRIVEFVTGEPANHDICTMCVVDHDALVARVEALAAEVNTEAKDAGYAYDKVSNALVVAPATQGIAIDNESVVAAIEDALASASNGDPARLAIKAEAVITEPTSYEPGQGIFVDTRNCRVILYEDGSEVVRYACTPGMSGYETPKGDFYLLYKDAAPTWYNPHSEWASGMEETIGPGPSNPLGLRALAVSCGGGIFIHGTTSTGSLGHPGSHGCIRISNSNIVDLHDRVSEGIPIIIR